MREARGGVVFALRDWSKAECGAAEADALLAALAEYEDTLDVDNEAFEARSYMAAVFVALRAWAKAECGATEADVLLVALAKYENDLHVRCLGPLARLFSWRG
jgi:hypothetical protein